MNQSQSYDWTTTGVLALPIPVRYRKACISKDGGESCVLPSVKTASDGSYPIARPLLMYTNGEPTGEIKAYLDFILSDEGQCIIAKKGYAPVRDVACD